MYAHSWLFDLGADARAVLVHEDFIEKLRATYAVQREDWWEGATWRTAGRDGWVAVVLSSLGARGWELVSHSITDTPYGSPWEDGFILRQTRYTFKRPLRD